MANTTGVQYTRTYSTSHMSKQRSETILIMNEIRIRVEDGLSSHMSQELHVGIVRRKQRFLSTGCIWSSVVTNVRQGANHRIRGGGESHQTSDTIMIKVHWYCYRSSLWQLVYDKVQSLSPCSWSREARVASRRGNVAHSLRVNYPAW